MTFSVLGTMASYVPKVGVTGTVDLSTAVVKGAGMDLITPTSVAGGSLSGASVTFSASAEVSVNGCFTSAYENYRVMINLTTNSAESQLNLRYRVAGTNSIVNYYYGGASTNWDTAVVGGFAGNNLTSTFVAYGVSGNNGMAILDIMSPQLAVRTQYIFGSLNSNTPGNNRNGAGVHTVATAYDGFSLLHPSGNMTGTLRIYGMRNS